MTVWRLGLTILVILTIFSGACLSTSQQRIDSNHRIYLQNNTHAQAQNRDTKASDANWKDPGIGHIVIPVNTPIAFGRFKRGFLIKNLIDGERWRSNSMGKALSTK